MIVTSKIQYLEVSIDRPDQGLLLDNPDKLFDYLKPKTDLFQEVLTVIGLDNKLNLLKEFEIARGTTNQVSIKPSDIFRTLLNHGCSAFIVTHNHPSGRCEPSEEDHIFTKKVQKASEMLGIRFIDHIIVGDTYYSFKREGFL